MLSCFTPLFRELETRDNLEFVTVKDYVTAFDWRYDEPAAATLLPLLSRILEAFQRNDKLGRLQFIEVKVPRHFTPTFLGALEAANLTSLHLEKFTVVDAESLALTLNRSTNLKTLGLHCCDDALVLPILLNLPVNTTLTKLCYTLVFHSSEEISQALKNLLVASKSLQSFELHYWTRIPVPARLVSNIVEGLIQSTNVTDVSLTRVWAAGTTHPQVAVCLSHLLRSKTYLSTLRLDESEKDLSPGIYNTLAEVLRRPKSPLRNVYLVLNQFSRFPFTAFRNLVRAVANSGVEHFAISVGSRGVRSGARVSPMAMQEQYFQVLLEAIPSFKVKTFTYGCTFVALNRQQERQGIGIFDIDAQQKHQRDQSVVTFLAALKRNYNIKHVEIADGILSNEENEQLDFILDRNRRLADWVENPALVPPLLWPTALMLALKAGKETLYQSLLALTGHDIGAPDQQSNRKRKRSSDDDDDDDDISS